MGGDWQQRNVSAGDAGAHGLAKGHASLWMGAEPGTTDNDQVSKVLLRE